MMMIHSSRSIPNDREQEYCQERRLCVRTHDNKECFQWAAAVEVCSIFKLLRKSSEELTEDEDKQTCTESVCKQCRKIHCPTAVDKRC